MTELDFLYNSPVFWLLVFWTSFHILTKVFKLNKHGFIAKFYQIKIKIDVSKITFFERITRHPFGNSNVFFTFSYLGIGFFLISYLIIDFFINRDFITEGYLILISPEITVTSSESISYYLLSILIITTIKTFSQWITIASERIPVKYSGLCIDIRGFTGFVEINEKIKNIKLKIKLKIISAGLTSIFILFLVLTFLLLTNPFFTILLPEPLLSTFYELPDGVLVLSVIENAGAEKAGLLKNDIITSINNKQIFSPADFPNLDPGEIANVKVLRNSQVLEFDIETMYSPEDPERGLLGIMRDNTFTYKPVMNFVEWDNPNISWFLFLLWLASFSFILIPLPKLNNGGEFIHTILEEKLSKKRAKIIMILVYCFTIGSISVIIFLLVFGIGFPLK